MKKKLLKFSFINLIFFLAFSLKDLPWQIWHLHLHSSVVFFSVLPSNENLVKERTKKSFFFLSLFLFIMQIKKQKIRPKKLAVFLFFLFILTKEKKNM